MSIYSRFQRSLPAVLEAARVNEVPVPEPEAGAIDRAKRELRDQISVSELGTGVVTVIGTGTARVILDALSANPTQKADE